MSTVFKQDYLLMHNPTGSPAVCCNCTFVKSVSSHPPFHAGKFAITSATSTGLSAMLLLAHTDLSQGVLHRHRLCHAVLQASGRDTIMDCAQAADCVSPAWGPAVCEPSGLQQDPYTHHHSTRHSTAKSATPTPRPSSKHQHQQHHHHAMELPV
jgi:hypothetical protein